MDISTFRQLADETSAIIVNWPSDLIAQYQFLGLPQTGNYSTNFLGEEVYNRIRNSFSPGKIRIAEECSNLIAELIYDQIIDGKPIEPYCELIAKLRDAAQSANIFGNGSIDEWRQAIENAHLSFKIMSLDASSSIARTYSNHYVVAYAAIRLKSIGYSFERVGSKITISNEAEARLIQKIESIISELGGLYVARKVTDILSGNYDKGQERYHIVVHKNAKDPQEPLIPWGYLLQLAVKYCRDLENSPGTKDPNRFRFLIELVRDYATILEVQDYAHFPHFPYVANKMMLDLQRKAVSDLIYKMPQVRGSDVSRILRGLVDDTFLDARFEKGWTIRHAIAVIDAILSHKQYGPGMSRIFARDVRRLCPEIDSDLVDIILGDVLSHPASGANQNFSRPTDVTGNAVPDFSKRPLLKRSTKSYMMIDRSLCAAAFMEAIFSQMRMKDENVDKVYLGKAIERFTREVLLQHNIKSHAGTYWVEKRRWECDILVETKDHIILIEVKKKALPQLARAGSDVFLLLALTQSLLEAQKQAGNHHMRLLQDGYLDLDDNGMISRIELKGRKVERIALSLTEFGSFHDRTFLEKFVTAASQLTFNVSYPEYEHDFEKINKVVNVIKEQNAILYPAADRVRPYFNCWFFSLPQLLILLEGVDGPEAFRSALWKTRGISTGKADLYYELRYVESMEASDDPFYHVMRNMADQGKTFVTGL